MQGTTAAVRGCGEMVFPEVIRRPDFSGLRDVASFSPGRSGCGRGSTGVSPTRKARKKRSDTGEEELTMSFKET